MRYVIELPPSRQSRSRMRTPCSPGPPHMVRWSQLRRSCQGDGARSKPEARHSFLQNRPTQSFPEVIQLAFPSQTNDLHHEIEMVVAIGLGGNDIQHDRALDHVTATRSGST